MKRLVMLSTCLVVMLLANNAINAQATSCKTQTISYVKNSKKQVTKSTIKKLKKQTVKDVVSYKDKLDANGNPILIQDGNGVNPGEEGYVETREQEEVITKDYTCTYYTAQVKSYSYYSNKKTKTYKIVKYNSSNKVTYNYTKNKYSNGKNKQILEYKNYNNGKYKTRTTHKYYSNGKKSYYNLYKRNSSAKATYNYTKKWYKKGKLKEVAKNTNYHNGKYKKRTYIKYRSTGKKSYVSYTTRNNSAKNTNVKKYYYNKKGQLRSNQYGKAKRIVYKYYSNGKVSSRTTHTYDAKGKLTNKKVKYYKQNKPKPKAPTRTEFDKMEIAIINMVNDERSKRGITQLAVNNKLMKGAEIRSKELQYCMMHTRPDSNKNCDIWGDGAETVLAEVDYTDNFGGENIHARSKSDMKYTAKAIYDEFYKSESHRDNMLNEDHDEIGVKIYYNSKTNTMYVVQLFGQK